MGQDAAQNFLFYGIILIGIIFILIWSMNRMSCNEKYSTYGVMENAARTGMSYLDAYEQQDYYLKYPYIYPSSNSYITRWYANRNLLDKSRYDLGDQPYLY